MASRGVKTAVSVLFSLALLLALVLQVEWSRISVSPLNPKPTWLLAALALSLLILLVRSLRFLSLLRSPFLIILPAVAAQNLLLRITPFRLGEFLFPYLLKLYAREGYSTVVVALLYVRLLDFWMLLSCVLLFGYAAATDAKPGHVLVLIAILLTISTVLVFFHSLFQRILRFGDKVALRVGLRRDGLLIRILSGLLSACDEARHLNFFARLSVWGLTIVIGVLQLLMLATLARSLSFDIPLLATFFGVTVAQLASALPVSTVGAFGTYELGWTVGFVTAGAEPSDAIVAAFSTQLITLAFAALWGMLGWTILRSRTRLMTKQSAET